MLFEHGPTPSLARYFSRCWSKPLSVTAEARAQGLEQIQRRLALLRSSNMFGTEVVLELEHSIPKLFASDYPQVLTHGNLSVTNTLVSEDTCEIT